MKFVPLSLNGAYEVLIEPHQDARGFFSRFYCNREFKACGLNTEWVQMNLSMSNEVGTLRGMHFQRGEGAEVKLVRCIRGRAFDVILDLRGGSSTFGQHAVIKLDAQTHNSIYIPKGIAHGFQALEDTVELQYLHSNYYDQHYEGGIDALDKDLEILWPLPVTKRSERDMNLLPLSKVSPL